MFQRSPRPGWMAIDLQPRSVRVAHVVRAGGSRARVALMREFARGESDAEDLLRVRRSVGLAGLRCTTALDAGAYHLVQLPAPAVPPAEAKEALRWAVKDSIDFAVEDAILDAMPIPADGTRVGRPLHVIAVAARRDRVRARMRAFERAGVRLTAIDVAEIAQRNLGALYEQDDRGLAFLALDENRGLLTFTRKGELYALRHLEFGARALTEDSAKAPRHLVFERLTLELQRSLDNFDRQFSQVALPRLLIAPFAGRDALVDHLRDMLSLAVEPIELGDAIDFSGHELASEAEQAAWIPALGLALRPDDAP